MRPAKASPILTLSALLVFMLACTTPAAAPTQAPAKPAAADTAKTAPAAPAAAAPTGDKTVMKLGTAVAENSIYPGYAFQVFKEELEKRTNGRIEVQVVCCGGLGPEEELLQAMSFGTVQGAAVTTGLIVATVPEFALPGMPFIFRNDVQAKKVLDSEVGKDLNEKLVQKMGVRNLGYLEIGNNWAVNSKRPINSIEDFKGLKVRVPPDPVQVAAWQSLGTNPVPMAWTELYSGLQTGVVDGLEATINGIWDAKFYEVTKYMVEVGNYYRAAIFGVSDKFYKAQPADIQKAIDESAAIAVQKEREKIQETNRDLVAKFKEKGIEITSPDLSKARDLMAPVYDQFKTSVPPELVKRVDAVN
jgi:tripartite ATP-independent transporter DctP family solute receptor